MEASTRGRIQIDADEIGFSGGIYGIFMTIGGKLAFALTR
jgi:hypothetical protein